MPAPGPTTLIDAVDERNEPIRLVPRSAVFSEHANFRTLHVLVTNLSGDLLLQQLSPSRERHPLRWGSSVAGYLFAGESYVDAARRRTAEELGVSPEVVDLGVLPVSDDGVTKFVGVFSASSDTPRVVDLGHTAALDFWPVDRVEREMTRTPESFTPTLRAVFPFWKSAVRAGVHGP